MVYEVAQKDVGYRLWFSRSYPRITYKLSVHFEGCRVWGGRGPAAGMLGLGSSDSEGLVNEDPRTRSSRVLEFCGLSFC